MASKNASRSACQRLLFSDSFTTRHDAARELICIGTAADARELHSQTPDYPRSHPCAFCRIRPSAFHKTEERAHRQQNSEEVCPKSRVSNFMPCPPNSRLNGAVPDPTHDDASHRGRRNRPSSAPASAHICNHIVARLRLIPALRPPARAPCDYTWVCRS